jgi:hypothetical protein
MSAFTTLHRLLPVLIGSIIPLSGASAAAEEKPPTPRIAVVKTWQDLIRQPAIDMGGGVRVRLGIEAAKTPRWSGVLLYCLTEGFKRPEGGSGPVPLGPVFVTCTLRDGLRRLKEKANWARKASEREENAAYLLFVKPLVATRMGTYKVRVRDGTDKLLAQAELVATSDFFHPWMPWGQPHERDYFNNDADGIALPRVGALDPFATLSAERVRDVRFLKERLPTLLPQRQSPGFVIQMKGKGLHIKSARQRLILGRPHSRFLVRWWVNDRPFGPEQKSEFWGEAYHELIRTGHELTLPLELDPRRFGAVKGDRIGLQVVYCPGGWAWCSRTRSMGFGRAQPALLSNRINVVVGEDKR